MGRTVKYCLLFLVLALCTLGAKAPAGDSVLLKAMQDELNRSYKNLKGKEYAPLYYLQYEVTENAARSIRASYGAIQSDDTERSRYLDVAARVGSYSLDNTHELRGGGYDFYGSQDKRMPLTDDPDAIKTTLWLATDAAFKDAQERYTKVKSERAVKVAEEDTSPDFSAQRAPTYVSAPARAEFNADEWKQILKVVSARFKGYPFILTSNASIKVDGETKYIVDSEGGKIQFGQSYLRVGLYGATKADDGMDLYRYRSYEARDAKDLPSKESLIAAADSIADELDKLRKAPLVEPYIGPAILMSKASGVFFHEIFGHRIEGSRQKRTSEGQTFTKKVGEKILPDFISVRDDPSMETFKGKTLWGHYQFDDEGVPSQAATIVENGVLKGFLMSRSPIRNFAESNGHGRRQHGRSAVSRQGNLIVKSSKAVSLPELKALLIEECKKQGKPYGLIFEDISGGFTMLGRYTPQAFKVIPLLVYRVYADGRRDEVVRGVDIVGTPLTCFARIVATADDDDIFNGTCGAESGWVPVSAVSPSILVSEIEVEKKAKEQDKPPVLARPDQQDVGSEDALMKAMADELARSVQNLKMEKVETPYYIEYTVRDIASVDVNGSFGAITSSDSDRHRDLFVDLRVGDYKFDNTNYISGGYGSSFGDMLGGGNRMVIEDDYNALRNQIWLATDDAYKNALDELSQKRAYVKTKTFEEMPDDMSRVTSCTESEPRAELTADREEWNDKIAKISALFKKHPGIRDSNVHFFAYVSNQYFVNSEGSRTVRPDVLYGLEARATAQADDGMEVSDFVTFYARESSGLPPVSEMESGVEEMASSLEKRAKAGTMDDYTGPVLFLGQASAEFFEEMLGTNVSNPRGPLSDNEMIQAMIPGGKLSGKIGRSVLPAILDVVDVPKRASWQGKELIGSYKVDDDGVPAESVLVVDDGKLTGLLMSRIPTKKLQASNGHGRAEGGYVAGRMGNLIVESSKTTSINELTEEFKEMCKDYDLNYGVVVEKMSVPKFSAEPMEGMRAFFGEGREQAKLLSAPVAVYKLDFATGQKTPVRGCDFSGVTFRTMRDIAGVGDDAYVHDFLSMLVPGQSGVPTSIVAPSILVEEMELKKSGAENPRLPILKNPYFEKKM
jgi:predicted Zn-dependent protease